MQSLLQHEHVAVTAESHMFHMRNARAAVDARLFALGLQLAPLCGAQRSWDATELLCLQCDS